jgi:hypothetical protein
MFFEANRSRVRGPPRELKNKAVRVDRRLSRASGRSSGPFSTVASMGDVELGGLLITDVGAHFSNRATQKLQRANAALAMYFTPVRAGFSLGRSFEALTFKIRAC